LEVFTVDPVSTIYHRAAGALAVFTADESSPEYNRATGAS